MSRFIIISIFLTSLICYSKDNQKNLEIFYSPRYEKFDLSSSSYSVSQPSTLGHGVSINYKFLFDRDKNEQLIINLDYFKIEQKLPTGISPQKVSKTDQGLGLRYLRSIYSSEDQRYFSLGLTYDYLSLNSNQTSPQIVFSDYQMHLLGILSNYEAFKQNDRTLEIYFGIKYPLTINENLKSGTFNPELNYLFGTRIKYQYSYNLMVSFGIIAEYQKIKFSGSDQRGLSHVSENRQLISLPLGVEYDF